MKSTYEFISSLFQDEHGFRRTKAGVGRPIILRFLGKNWKNHTKKERKEHTVETTKKEPKVEQNCGNDKILVCQSCVWKRMERTSIEE